MRFSYIAAENRRISLYLVRVFIRSTTNSGNRIGVTESRPRSRHIKQGHVLDGMGMHI